MSVEPATPRILFIVSGPAPLSLSILNHLEERFAEHQVDLVVAEQLLGQLSEQQRRRVVFVVGRSQGRLAFLWHARRASYWMVTILLTGHPGYLGMKVAGLLLGIGRIVICYNEHADAFAVDRRHVPIIARYIGHRLGARRGFAFMFYRLVLGLVYAVVGEALGLIWMTTQIVYGAGQGWWLANTSASDRRK